MPKIADYQASTQAGMPPVRAEHLTAPPIAGDASVLRSVENAGASVAGLIAKNQDDTARAWASSTLSQARLDWTQQLIDRQTSADPGAPDFTPTLLTDYDQYVSKALESAPNAPAKRYLNDRMQAFRTELGGRAMEFEAKSRIDYRTDQYTSAIDNTRKLMNTDPDQYNQALAERLAEIDSSGIPPIQKSALRQKAVDTISEAAVWSQIQRSPTAFLQGIGFMSTVDPETGKIRKSSGDLNGKTGNNAFDMLPFDRRVQMFQSAIQAKAQIDSDANTAAEKMRKQASDDAAKDLWGWHADGKLNRTVLEQYKPILSVAEYHSMLTALNHGDAPQKTDPKALENVLKLQLTDPQAAMDLAFKYHQNGLLSNDTLVGEVNRARTLDRQDGPKSPYERARQYVVTAMDPGPLVHDPVGRGRMADAVSAFDDWFLQNPKAAPADVEKRSKEIVSEHKLVDFSKTVLQLPQPRYGSIRRNANDAAGILKDIATVGAETKRRHDAKLINDAEYADQMATLDRWRVTANGAPK